MRLSADTAEALLEHWPVARLATVGPGGAPHQVPVVFARYAGELFTPIDGKPKAGGQLARVRNVWAHPDVCLLLDAYSGDWSRLWWLRVDGQARVIDSSDSTLAPPALDALEGKYPQYAEVPVLRPGGVLIAIGVGRVSSWCAGEPAEGALRAQLEGLASASGSTSSISEASPGTPTRSGKP